MLVLVESYLFFIENRMSFRCMLHNFGGNIEMYGNLDSISSGPVDARVSENSTMVFSRVHSHFGTCNE